MFDILKTVYFPRPIDNDHNYAMDFVALSSRTLIENMFPLEYSQLLYPNLLQNSLIISSLRYIF